MISQANVVNIRPTNTASTRQLLDSVPSPNNGQTIDREEFIKDLPLIFDKTLSLILADFDIEAWPESNLAVACRVLAATRIRLGEVID